ncbi:glutathione synthetase [Lewinellaceae bacterium SD302]|nr:glutathione synthetase [Lewinellaceae bacterium SD302]
MRILVITDHAGHSAENAIYSMLLAMLANPKCDKVEVATRSISENMRFFRGDDSAPLYTAPVTKDFAYHPNGRSFRQDLRQSERMDFDGIWLRLPPPLSEDQLSLIAAKFPFQQIQNDPAGIIETGNKKFLLNFPDITPRMSICDSMASIEAMLAVGPLVLKPFAEYGGRGLIRIDTDRRVWAGRAEKDWAWLESKFPDKGTAYLGVEFLRNVDQGDKRIVVVNGEIMGAALRLPAKDSWLCNVAAGGTSNPARVDEDENRIVATVDPVLKEHGIIMYGVDTLVGNAGRRVLSELNTTSIGGLPQIGRMNNEPVVERAVDLILDAFSAR